MCPQINLKYYWPRALLSDEIRTFIKCRPHTKTEIKLNYANWNLHEVDHLNLFETIDTHLEQVDLLVPLDDFNNRGTAPFECDLLSTDTLQLETDSKTQNFLCYERFQTLRLFQRIDQRNLTDITCFFPDRLSKKFTGINLPCPFLSVWVKYFQHQWEDVFW